MKSLISNIQAQKDKLVGLLKIAIQENSMTYRAVEEMNILFEPEPVLFNMLNLMKNADLPENPYGMEFLKSRYKDFIKDKEPLFTIDKLFEDGWLIWCVDEWNFNIDSKSHYKMIQSYNSEEERQIIEFLKELSKIPYLDELKIYVQPDTEVPEGILRTEDGKTFIETCVNLWDKIGSVVFSKWWDDIVEMDDEAESVAKKEQMDRWFFFWRLLYHCWSPDRYVRHSEDLFCACLERLEGGQRRFTWKQMEVNLRRKLYTEHENVRKQGYEKIIPDFPESPIEIVQYVENRRDIFWYRPHPFGNASRIFHICVRQYEHVGQELRQRFLECLSIPYFCIELNEINVNPKLMADCLAVSEIFVIAARVIWNKLYKFVSGNQYIGVRVLEESTKYILDILEKKLEQEAKGRNEWLNTLIDLTWYILQENSCGFKRVTERQNYVHNLQDIYTKWYAQVIVPQENLHNRVLAHFRTSFEKNKEMKATEYFTKYVTLIDLDTKDDCGEQIFEIYSDFMRRAQSEDLLLSRIDWSFWQSNTWILMMKWVVSSEKRLNSFLNLLKLEDYKNIVQKRIENSPLLDIGVAGLIQLYLITIPLLELHKNVYGRIRRKIENAFVECFLGFQIERCDPFEAESICLLQCEAVVQRCMESLSGLDEGKREDIVTALQRKPVEKTLFLLEYVQNQKTQRRLIDSLIERLDEDFTQNIFYFSTWQKLINILLEICIELGEERLVDKASELISQFKEAVDKKGQNFKKDYLDWLEFAELQLELLRGNEQKVLDSEEDSINVLFYKALIYLNRDDIESLEKAEELYERYIEREECCPAYINYFVACVRICTHPKSVEEEKTLYLRKAKAAVASIREKYTLTLYEEMIVCSNELFLYATLKDNMEFWKASGNLPESLKYECSCAQYIVQMYAFGGEKEKAEEYLDELIERYGQTDLLLQLEHDIKENGEKNRFEMPKGVAIVDDEIKRLRHAVNRIKSLSERDCALVRLQKDSFEKPKEAHLLYMVLDAVHKMSQYSDYVMYDSNTANENTYNKFIQMFFDQRQKELWDFYIKDQTQEGSATGQLMNKRQSTGSLDLAIYHNTSMVSIVEGIKLDGIDSNRIEEHIRKIVGYDYVNAETAFLLIFADTPDPKKMWNEYETSVLDNMKNRTRDNKWHIIEQIPRENIELIKQNIGPNPLYMCMTVHECDSTGQRFNLYHIMVDIRKQAAKEEAVSARSLTKRGRG